ncbi:Hypp9134 [Branchiostoma lanceolatum]|uniref:Hypp9134 protein n=1 Tax=Branchiostoma lanceolatum TaxID=7740 RepID=A0A8J9ZDX6_BRALA|nr:Hypp9134 [Branchiostoma lanceolatum]
MGDNTRETEPGRGCTALIDTVRRDKGTLTSERESGVLQFDGADDGPDNCKNPVQPVRDNTRETEPRQRVYSSR